MGSTAQKLRHRAILLGVLIILLFYLSPKVALVPNYPLQLSSFLVLFNLLVSEHSSETYDLDITLTLKEHDELKKLRLSYTTMDWASCFKRNCATHFVIIVTDLLNL